MKWVVTSTMKDFNIEKGDRFYCRKDVMLEGTDTCLYKAGRTYISELDFCITDELGDRGRTWIYEPWNTLNWPDHFEKCDCQKCKEVRQFKETQEWAKEANSVGTTPHNSKRDKDYFDSVREEYSTNRVFDSGAVRDSNEGKPFIHTLLGYTRQRFGYHMAKNASKYGPFNFLKGIPTDAALESLDRHLASYMSGDRSEDHLSAIIFGVQLCMLNEEREEGIKANHYFK